MSQWELKVKTCNCLKRGRTRGTKSQLAFALDEKLAQVFYTNDMAWLIKTIKNSKWKQANCLRTRGTKSQLAFALDEKLAQVFYTNDMAW